MANSIYSEVTAVSTTGFERDRVLDKLTQPKMDLPYTVEDITISHNDFAVSDVYNDSIKKLYDNYLWLIANAEIIKTNSPISAVGSSYISIDTSGTPHLSATTVNIGTKTNKTPLSSLSGVQETAIFNKTDNTEKFVFFNYSRDMSVISETNTNLTTITNLLTGNEVEFNKTFKFKNVVSVDVSGNFLFVLDKDANTVFKFDISGFLTDDPALKRTGISDTDHPGRYLLKTIGGDGVSQSKNKLNKPQSLSVYKDRIYILDNGHSSLKVFDLDFNFVHEVTSPSKFTGVNGSDLVSIVVDQYSDTNLTAHGYILTKYGSIIEYDVSNNTLSKTRTLWKYWDTRLNSLSGIDLSSSFHKIVNCKSQKNILYIANDGRIYKYYKTNLYNRQPIANFDFTVANIDIGTLENHQSIQSFDTVDFNNKEYLAVTTLNNGTLGRRAGTYLLEDTHDTIKLYNDNFYTNYFTLSDILVLPQEIVNNITFNKTTKKLIYNHYSLFENLNKKIFSFYKTGSLVEPRDNNTPVPTLCTINAHEFSKPSSFNDNVNMFIGINEPILTDVINRPLKLLYEQQESLFDLIKETSLNTNPPSGYTIKLPGKSEDYPNILSIPSTAAVTAGNELSLTVTRTNYVTGVEPCNFRYYTTAGTAPTTDYDHIESTEPSIGLIKRNEFTTDIKFDTKRLFTREIGQGASKTFNIIIEAVSNCEVDPDANSTVVSINPIGDIYTVGFSTTTLSLSEGLANKGRVQIDRTSSTGSFDEQIESAVNVRITPTHILTSEYVPVVSGATTHQVVSSNKLDFVAVSGVANSQFLSANEIGSTSTVFFTDEVSSIVFDIHALNNTSEDENKGELKIELSNPSFGTKLGTDTLNATIGQKYKTANLFLSAISGTYRADTTSETLLSCVNIYQALSADSTFQSYSATNPFEINFTVNKPLSVFSTNVLSGALQFWTEAHDLVYTSNILNVNIEGDGSSGPWGSTGNVGALVGKGGTGGHGALWLSGSDFTTSGDVSSSDNYVVGENGGPAILPGTYFSSVSVYNNGVVYGGAGGGAGGVLGLSASTMAHVASLSAGCGGGGGGGIHLSGAGTGGFAAVNTEEDIDTISVNSKFFHIYLNHGTDGGANGAGGAGGGFSNPGTSPYTANYPDGIKVGGGNIGSGGVTGYPMLTGDRGGNIGEDGIGDNAYGPELPLTVDSSLATISARYAHRVGGSVGEIITGNVSKLSGGSVGLWGSSSL